jgi:hypothetical protein
VRRSLGTLDLSNPADKKILDQFTEGVRILRQRSDDQANDPRGWTVQAGLHAERCQHGNWWFFPWHRAYVYYFERLVQDAVSDSSFALPYWDWTDGNEVTLPNPFRELNSPLYDDNRDPDVNGGRAQLDWTFYDDNYNGVLNYVLTRDGFVPSFGSPQVDSFPGLETTHGDEQAHGDVEGGPHDTVHVWVGGGQNPDMGVPDSAALDPIFWLHHCNIDRLWTRWLAASPRHKNPTDATWTGQKFEFFDVNGQPEQIAVNQLLNSQAAPLNYRYDDEALSRRDRAPSVPSGEVRMGKRKLMGPGATAEIRYEIGTRPLIVPIKLSARFRATLAQTFAAVPKSGASARVLLTVEDIAFDGKASGVVEVYLSAPAGRSTRHAGKPAAVGTLTLFGGHTHADHAAPTGPGTRRKQRHQMAADEPGPRVSRVFDVTEVLHKHYAAKQGGKNELRLKFVRRALKRERQPMKGQVTFSRAVLQLQELPDAPSE